ncbi:hypothetical protein WDW37_16715 [Bdellovibrionota bacterium FG-1]
MKYDAQSSTLQFSSAAQVEQFHAQMTQLLREAMIAAGNEIKDPHEAAQRAQAVFEEYSSVILVLNELRSGLPRRGT